MTQLNGFLVLWKGIFVNNTMVRLYKLLQYSYFVELLVIIKEIPFSCLYTTSSSDPSLFKSTSWVMLVSWADPFRCVCPLASAAACWPTALVVRKLHLPQKVMKPATVNTFSTSKIFHLLITKAMKDFGVRNPANRILEDISYTNLTCDVHWTDGLFYW